MEALSPSGSPNLKTVSANGLDLAVWEWPGYEPALWFAHATSFHGRCWDQIARQFPGRRRLAMDLRGHGRSGKPAPPYHLPAFGHDLVAVAKHLNVRDAVGIGHSTGGHSVVSAAALRPETFSALLLIDPTIFPPEYYGAALLDASFILRRRNTFYSPDQMFERFRSRPPFASWQPEILRDYCEFGLVPCGEGLVLACPPPVEASIYGQSTASEANLYREIPSITQTVVILRAGTMLKPGVLDPSASPTAPDLASKFPRGRDLYLKDSNHYIPMERPEMVVAEIERLT